MSRRGAECCRSPGVADVLASGASVLELFHPLGHAATVRVIGRACREDLALCPQPIAGTTGCADLVVLAPSSDELATRGWLENAVCEAAGSLQRDGVLYVLAPRRGRRKMQALLRGHGLKIATTLLHHPDWPHAGTLVPLKRQTLAYAFSHLVRTHPLRRRIALGLIRVPGALALVRALLPHVGLVAQWQDAPAQSSWFTQLLEDRGPTGGIVLNTSWRGRDGAVLLHAVDGERGDATAIAKAWLSTGDGGGGGDREAAGLQAIAARAGQFGARVPKLLGQGTLVDQVFVAETAVAGEKAAVLLHDHPERVAGVLTRLANWLRAWNKATRHEQILTQPLLGQLLLDPVAELMGADDARQAWARMSALAGRLLGQPAVFVAAHGDLTMVNVLVDRAGGLGIIDWETASLSGLPLSDFFYTAVDAVAAVEDYRDRPAAFEACFAASGRHRTLVAGLQETLVRELGLSSDEVALSFYASWFQFALAERRETAKAAPDEFLRIALAAAAGDYAHVMGSAPDR